MEHGKRKTEVRRDSASGGELCPTLGMTEFPPAHAGGGDMRGVGATLGSATADHASECPAGTKPRHRSATPPTGQEVLHERD